MHLRLLLEDVETGRGDHALGQRLRRGDFRCDLASRLGSERAIGLDHTADRKKPAVAGDEADEI